MAQTRQWSKRRGLPNGSAIIITTLPIYTPRCGVAIAGDSDWRGLTTVHSTLYVQALRSGKLDVIVHVDMLGEGFDHPNLSVAVIFCSFRSMPRFSQFVGRAVRRLPNKGGKLKPQEQVRGNPIEIMSCVVRRHIVILMTSDEINIRVVSWFRFSM
jgi:hypothetical protein